MKAKRRYLYDIILVVALLALFLSLFFFFYEKNDGYYIEVYEGSELTATYSLARDGEYSIGDGSNIIKVEDGFVYMKHADCPDGWCKQQGKINISGERITCLPNRVMIIVKEVES